MQAACETFFSIKKKKKNFLSTYKGKALKKNNNLA